MPNRSQQLQSSHPSQRLQPLQPLTHRACVAACCLRCAVRSRMKGAELFGSTLPAVVEGFIGRYLDVKWGGDRWMAWLKDSDRVLEELLDDRPLVARPSAQELRAWGSPRHHWFSKWQVGGRSPDASLLGLLRRTACMPYGGGALHAMHPSGQAFLAHLVRDMRRRGACQGTTCSASGRWGSRQPQACCNARHARNARQATDQSGQH